jgi:hypothetical protein
MLWMRGPGRAVHLHGHSNIIAVSINGKEQTTGPYRRTYRTGTGSVLPDAYPAPCYQSMDNPAIQTAQQQQQPQDHRHHRPPATPLTAPPRPEAAAAEFCVALACFFAGGCDGSSCSSKARKSSPVALGGGGGTPAAPPCSTARAPASLFELPAVMSRDPSTQTVARLTSSKSS